MYKDRHEAGLMLAEKLRKYRGADAVVLGLPRGGVVVAAAVAKKIDLPLDIVIARKIGHPNNPEYAIGVVDERGTTILNPLETETVDQTWLREEMKRQQQEAKRRVETYRGKRPQLPLSEKTVIIVDDGIATGLTMRAAIRSLRRESPIEIIAAAPIAPREVVECLRGEADDVIVLDDTEPFLGAIGAYYKSFPQVTDEEVIRIMADYQNT